jgi:hypothetical protein
MELMYLIYLDYSRTPKGTTLDVKQEIYIYNITIYLYIHIYMNSKDNEKNIDLGILKLNQFCLVLMKYLAKILFVLLIGSEVVRRLLLLLSCYYRIIYPV